MKTEVDELLSDGFVLDEQEMRRIHGLLLQQMKQIVKEEDIQESFSVKYQNNLVAERSSLNDILSENNGGTWSIRSISIELNTKYNPDVKNRTRISLSIGKDSISIIYRIYGDDRDWVYITKSLLEERIKKIKRTRLENYSALFLVGSFLGVISIFLLVISFTASISIPLRTLLILLAITTGLLTATIPIRNYFFPPYNFCWGDYLDTYNKRKSRGNLIIFGVIGTLALGIIASTIATLLTIGLTTGH